MGVSQSKGILALPRDKKSVFRLILSKKNPMVIKPQGFLVGYCWLLAKVSCNRYTSILVVLAWHLVKAWNRRWLAYLLLLLSLALFFFRCFVYRIVGLIAVV